MYSSMPVKKVGVHAHLDPPLLETGGSGPHSRPIAATDCKYQRPFKMLKLYIVQYVDLAYMFNMISG